MNLYLKATQGYESVGGIVTFRFHEGKYNNEGFYNIVMKTLIELAKKIQNISNKYFLDFLHPSLMI